MSDCEEHDEPLTLDVAIAHAEEIIELTCGNCQSEHYQLAQWLRELKAARELLERIQWSGWHWYNHRQQFETDWCPNCQERRPKHTETCELAKLVRRQP